MRRPGRAYLVLVAEQAEAVFADRAEATDYAGQHGDWAQVLMIPWWPAGAWTYGITAPAGGAGAGPGMPAEVLTALEHHTRVSRRCTGAGLDSLTVTGLQRYYCRTCQDRVY
jgi:hypothetical protein